MADDDAAARRERARALREQIKRLARGERPPPSSPREFTEPRKTPPRPPGKRRG